MEIPAPMPANQVAAEVKISNAEHFRSELEALLAKYPTVRLNVNHQITIDELVPKEPIAGTQEAPKE